MTSGTDTGSDSSSEIGSADGTSAANGSSDGTSDSSNEATGTADETSATSDETTEISDETTGTSSDESSSDETQAANAGAAAISEEASAGSVDTLTAEDEALTTAAAQVNDTVYETVQEAVDAISSSGTVVMVSDSTEAVTIPSGKSITLDLNGHTLTGTGDSTDDTGTTSNTNTSEAYSVITVYGSLTLTDSTAVLTTVSESNLPDGSTGVSANSTTTDSIEISAAAESSNGDNTSTTTTIETSATTYSTYYQDADGTYYKYTSGAVTGGTGTAANMSGVSDALTSYRAGGGIYISGGSLTVESGSVVKNTAYLGGGVCVNDGTLTINGGSISGNSADNGTNSSWNDGGGICAYGTTVTMTGGAVSCNSASTSGGGCVYNGSMTLSGGIISNNESATAGGMWIDKNCSHFTMTGGEISRNSAGCVGGVYIGTAATIEGGKISYNSATTEFVGGIYVSSTSLNISGGEVSYNTAGTYAGGIYAYNKCEVNIDGGEVSNNEAGTYAGGIYASDSEVTISGGEVSNNIAGTSAGGIRAKSSSVTISDGEISYNIASAGSGGGLNCDDGTVTMTGGIIVYNFSYGFSSSGESYAGGGVILVNETFTMSGGTIAWNYAEGHAGGVHVGSETSSEEVNQATSFIMTGGILVNNTAGISADDIFVNAYATVELENPDTVNADTVYEADDKGVQIDGWYNDGSGITEADAEKDRYDSDRVTHADLHETVKHSSDSTNHWYLVAAHARWLLSYDANCSDYTGSMDIEAYWEGNTVTAADSAFSRSGYVFAGWNTESDGTGDWYITAEDKAAAEAYGISVSTDDSTFSMPGSDVTLYAQWVAVYTVTYVDGVDDEEVFADQVYTGLLYGASTPSYIDADGNAADPVREGYTFEGWTPAVADTVTGDAVYTAVWADEEDEDSTNNTDNTDDTGDDAEEGTDDTETAEETEEIADDDGEANDGEETEDSADSVDDEDDSDSGESDEEEDEETDADSDDSEDAVLAKTGDSANPLIWFVLLAAAAVGIVLIGVHAAERRRA